MAFPTLYSFTDYIIAPDTTSASIPYPAVPTDGLVVIIVGTDGSATHSGATAGWLVNGSAGSNPRIYTYSRYFGSGASAGNLAFTLSSAESGSAHIFIFQGGYASNTEADDVLTAETSGTSANPNPPSHTPTFGTGGAASRDYYWIAAATWSSGSSITAAPSGYSDLVVTNDAPGTAHAGLASARKTATASSENPGTFTGSVSSGYAAVTVAIRPYNPITPVALAGTMGALSGNLSRMRPRALAGTMGALAGSLLNAPRKLLAGTAGAVTGDLAKSPRKLLAGTAGALTGSLAALKSYLQSAAGTMGTLTGAFAKVPHKLLDGSIAGPTGVLGKLPAKLLSGTMGALSGTLAAIKSYLRTVDGTMSSLTGALTKRKNQPLDGTMGDLAGALQRRKNQILAGTMGSLSGALSRLRGKPLSGSVGNLSGALTKRTYKSLSGTMGTLTGSLVKSAKLRLSGTMGALTGILSVGALGNLGLRRGTGRVFGVARGVGRVAAQPFRGGAAFFRPGRGTGRKG